MKRLFALAADRTELHNLAARDPERVRAMTKVFEDWQRASTR